MNVRATLRDIDMSALIETTLDQHPTFDAARGIYEWTAAIRKPSRETFGVSIGIDTEGAWRSLEVTDNPAGPITTRRYVFPC